MQPQNLLVAALSVLLGFDAMAAAPSLGSAKLTEAKNTVRYKAETAEERDAALTDVVKGADVLRTGERSLAELEFEDKTLTRLGSMSVFSFKADEREFRVDKGLALICMPKGSGGGRIVTSAITAAIEGTTVLVLGIGKIIFLEGSGKISTNDGKQNKPAGGGHIAFVENGELKVLPIALEPILNSRLITSRAHPLPTWPQIQEVAGAQGANAPSGVVDPAFRDEGIIKLVPPPKGPQK